MQTSLLNGQACHELGHYVVISDWSWLPSVALQWDKTCGICVLAENKDSFNLFGTLPCRQVCDKICLIINVPGRISILSHRICICVIVLFKWSTVKAASVFTWINCAIRLTNMCWKVHSTCFGYNPSLVAGRSSWDHNNVWVVIGTNILTSAVFTYLVVHMPFVNDSKSIVISVITLHTSMYPDW